MLTQKNFLPDCSQKTALSCSDGDSEGSCRSCGSCDFATFKRNFYYHNGDKNSRWTNVEDWSGYDGY